MSVLDLHLKLSLVIFMAGNLLDMGLRLRFRDAWRGLRHGCFVAHALIWGFVIGPLLAWLITRLFRLDEPFATGLLLMGLAPCAPFLPMVIDRAKGDLGYTAAFMLLTSFGTIVVMPVALPLLVKGLTVGAWAIARPLLLLILLPLAAGMALLRYRPIAAERLRPGVKKVTVLSTVVMLALCMVIYGKAMMGLPGTFAGVSMVLFFLGMAVLPYGLGIGLGREPRAVLSAGLSTRNLGAAMAPLFAAPDTDSRSIVMVVLGVPLMVAVSLGTAKWLSRKTAEQPVK